MRLVCVDPDGFIRCSWPVTLRPPGGAAPPCPPKKLVQVFLFRSGCPSFCGSAKKHPDAQGDAKQYPGGGARRGEARKGRQIGGLGWVGVLAFRGHPQGHGTGRAVVFGQIALGPAIVTMFPKGVVDVRVAFNEGQPGRGIGARKDMCILRVEIMHFLLPEGVAKQAGQPAEHHADQYNMQRGPLQIADVSPCG